MPDPMRITLKQNEPNPLFKKWLQELFEEAKAKNSKLTNILEEALNSISKYPVPLKSGAECAILKGFGKKLCLFLDQRLEVYYANMKYKETTRSNENSDDNSNLSMTNGDKMIVENVEIPIENKENVIDTAHVVHNDNNITDNLDGQQNKVKRKKLPQKSPKKYKPGFMTGAYALLVALLNNMKQNPNMITLTKEELIEKAQPFCEESFVRRKPDTFYTSWSSMRTLLTKNLVIKKQSRKAEFKLSDEGIKLAEEMLKEYENRATTNDLINKALSLSSQSDVAVASRCSSDVSEIIEFLPGSHDIILLIDKQETTGLTKKTDPTISHFNKYPDLKHEYRHLKVGDFTWIARHKTNTDQELVLPFIVERKRMDDLGSSIKDGRFHEQKFRLKRSGIKNVIYLVEKYGENKNVGLPIQSLMQAISNTRVQNGFKVHMTDSLKNSVRFLVMMTKKITIEYEDKHLKGGSPNDLLTFKKFNMSSNKNKPLTVSETFIKLLLQLQGVSVEKALAITSVYKTPKALIQAYRQCGEKEGELLLSNLKYGPIQKNVGKKLSKSIFQLFTIKHLN